MFHKSSIIAALITLCCASAHGDTLNPTTTIKFWNHTQNAYTATLFLIIDGTSEVSQTIYLKPHAREKRTFDENHVQFARLVIENEDIEPYIIEDPFSDINFSDCNVHIYEDKFEIY